jgi:hypothetical protein
MNALLWSSHVCRPSNKSKAKKRTGGTPRQKQAEYHVHPKTVLKRVRLPEEEEEPTKTSTLPIKKRKGNSNKSADAAEERTKVTIQPQPLRSIQLIPTQTAFPLLQFRTVEPLKPIKLKRCCKRGQTYQYYSIEGLPPVVNFVNNNDKFNLDSFPPHKRLIWELAETAQLRKDSYYYLMRALVADTLELDLIGDDITNCVRVDPKTIRLHSSLFHVNHSSLFDFNNG